MKQHTILCLMLPLWLCFGRAGTALGQTVYVEDDADKGLPCVTEEHYRTYVQPKLERNIRLLDSLKRSQGIDPAAKMGGGTVYLNWPLRMDENYSNINGVYSYFYISNFADLDPVEDLDEDEAERLDWMCFEGPNAKNYDQHNGADIVPYPFPWQMQDDESVDVIAAADGEVIYMEDGYFDRNCEKPHILGDGGDFNGGYYGNFVALRHDDLSVTIYAHIKQGTVAALEIGDYITQGTYLGKVGSSGNSSGPHLHFEYRITEASGYEEPWYDPEGCNFYPGESMWVSQLPYENPQLIRVTTHDSSPLYKSCSDYEAGENEDVYIANHFSSGQLMIINVALRDYFSGDEIALNIYNSSEVLQQSFTHVNGTDYERANIVFSTVLLGYSTGTYKIRVEHNGKYYYHYFTVGCPTAATYSGAQSGQKGYLNGDNITSTATISGVSTNNILYEAENYIRLNPGFKATQNCNFRGKIDACTLGGSRSADPIADAEEPLIFPNPNMGYCTVLIPQWADERSMLEVFDHTGKAIQAHRIIAGQASIALDLADVAKGMYYVRLSNGTMGVTEKVIVQ